MGPFAVHRRSLRGRISFTPPWPLRRFGDQPDPPAAHRRLLTMQPDVPAAGGSVCELCGEGAYGNMSGDRALALVRPARAVHVWVASLRITA